MVAFGSGVSPLGATYRRFESYPSRRMRQQNSSLGDFQEVSYIVDSYERSVNQIMVLLVRPKAVSYALPFARNGNGGTSGEGVRIPPCSQIGKLELMVARERGLPEGGYIGGSNPTQFKFLFQLSHILVQPLSYFALRKE